MQEYEYDDIYLDLMSVTILRSHLPANAKIRRGVKDEQVPIASVGFVFAEADWKEEQLRAWHAIKPTILTYINELGSQGWQLTKPLDLDLFIWKAPSNWWVFPLWVGIGLVTIGVGWIPAIYYFFAPTKVRLTFLSATLPLRRVRQQ